MAEAVVDGGTGRGEGEAIAALLGRAVAPERPFGLYLGRWGDGTPVPELTAALERRVFVEEFGTSVKEHDQAYRPFDGHSLFCLVADHRNRRSAGAARVVLPGAAQKTVLDIAALWGDTIGDLPTALPELDLAQTWDVATLAVGPGYRRGLVSQALHQLICTTAFRSGARWFLSILDVRVLRLFRLQLPDMFRPLPGAAPRLYGGSMSIPVWCDIAAHTARLRRRAPTLFETLFLGRNLEPVVSPPPEWGWRAR